VLSEAGREALADLEAGTATADAALRLGRRLVEAGIAHPRPRRIDPSDITVVVPVRDRPVALERCLSALGQETPVVVVDDGSRDAQVVAAVCAHHGAKLIRSECSQGPAHARNIGIVATDSQLLAFVDSDCIPGAGWLAAVCGHFVDPVVAAVAPRVRPRVVDGFGSVRARFADARSPCDMGPDERMVGPGTRLAYVPTAALVVRRCALPEPFDEALRYGEDVDLVWRLHDAGWRVRYEPAATVYHVEPEGWLGLSRRRWHYGTSAAPLSRRHRGRLAPAVLRPWPSIAGVLLLTGRARPAAAIVAVQGAFAARRLRAQGVPAHAAFVMPAAAVARTVIGLGRMGTTLYSPVLLCALAWNRTRVPAIVLLAASPLDEWVQRRPRLDPLRWTAASVLDDVAYGLGVWHGCVQDRFMAPLIPSFRSLHGARVAQPARALTTDLDQ
jgi:mycofactocin system glycosyltransferase